MPRTAKFDRKDLVLRARDLFWQQGWAGTSLKDLERTLGVQPGSFYAAFGSKDALYSEALDRYAADGAARLQRLADDLGPLEALKAHVRSFIERAVNDPAPACMLVKTLLEVQGRQDMLAEKAHVLLDEMEHQFQTLFATAQAGGEISALHSPERLARRYQSDLIGLRASAERKSVDVTALADEIAKDLDRLRAP